MINKINKLLKYTGRCVGVSDFLRLENLSYFLQDRDALLDAKWLP
jgi:hypothetical protein